MRYIYDKEKGEVVPAPADFRNTPFGSFGRCTSEGEQFDGLRTAEGVDISSRKKRREFMKLTGVTDPSDYRGGHMTKAAEARRKHFAGEVDTSGGRRKESIARALEQFRRNKR